MLYNKLQNTRKSKRFPRYRAIAIRTSGGRRSRSSQSQSQSQSHASSQPQVSGPIDRGRRTDGWRQQRLLSPENEGELPRRRTHPYVPTSSYPSYIRRRRARAYKYAAVARRLRALRLGRGRRSWTPPRAMCSGVGRQEQSRCSPGPLETPPTKALFTSKKFYKIRIVVFLFLFDKY